jgi:hypothetical protein
MNFAIGVVAGVVDLVWYHRGRLHVFDIKIGNDVVSDEQVDFCQKVVKNGGTAHVIMTLDQFKIIFKTLYNE